MDPIRQKLSSFLIEIAHKSMNSLDPQSVCAKDISELEDADAIIAQDIKKICQAASLPEITKIFVLAAQLKKNSGQKRNSIKNDLKKISAVVVTRAEAKSGPLKLPQSCRLVLLGV